MYRAPDVPAVRIILFASIDGVWMLLRNEETALRASSIPVLATYPFALSELMASITFYFNKSAMT